MSLDVIVYRSESPWSKPKEDLFIAGLRRHGILAETRRLDDIRPSDLAVIWAHRHGELFKLQRRAGAHYLVMERGYIGDIHNRRRWTSLGLDGLNGRARFPKPESDKRWHDNFGHVMKPWRADGDYAVVMGQVRGDASLRGFDITSWYGVAIERVKEIWQMPVHFRPHPQDDRTPMPDADVIDRGGLADCLAGAARVVTYNSNTGVDAVLAGVPTVAIDPGSMAWDMTTPQYHRMAMPNRSAWAAQLAYCQWTDAEIETGEAWDHINALLN